MNHFALGQRWVSDAEPELGLGQVVEIDGRQVVVDFPAAAERRRYAAATAPLRRARFRPGDAVRSRTLAGRVVAVREAGDLLVYSLSAGALGAVSGGSATIDDAAATSEVRESDLDATLVPSSPEERLLGGRTDPSKLFDLRLALLAERARWAASPVRGFAGGRIALVPHQLSVADAICTRPVPRALLSDEVGLGKTIEACLVIQRLLLSGRAGRILVLVPEHLVHQWFVELLRRFGLAFKLFDEERCAAIETGDPGVNPFLAEQLVLASLGWLAGEGPGSAPAPRAAQAQEAGFDLIVVDEAHHLDWTPAGPGLRHALVAALAPPGVGLLLLTATPEQLGHEAHFGRLHLLDPARHRDLASHEAERQRWYDVSAELDALLAERPSATREAQIAELVDLHGTGREVFRNTRAALATAFPPRVPRPVVLDAGERAPEFRAASALEFAKDLGETLIRETASPSEGPTDCAWQLVSDDPRVAWLLDLLRCTGDAKILLIAHTRAKVESLQRILRERASVNCAVFHEGMPLVQRDRAAAWFSEPEGTRLLLCSEIGSEGRNFQAAHHLVLFDLPLDPELLEQRIGRLDRIGQRAPIQIHAPYLESSAGEVLLRWVHEGLDALGCTAPAAARLAVEFGTRVGELALRFHRTDPAAATDELHSLVADTRERAAALAHELDRGRDRLLERSSHDPVRGASLVQEIAVLDEDRSTEDLLLRLFESFGVEVDEVGPRTYRLSPESLRIDAFPGLPERGLVGTFSRDLALAREDLAFLTSDHPMAVGGIDLLLGSPRGTTAFVHLPAAHPAFFLEVVFVLECVAAAALEIDRFLPAQPLRVVVDHTGAERTGGLTAQSLVAATDADLDEMLDDPRVGRQLVPAMLEAARDLAMGAAAAQIAAARAAMHASLGSERQRSLRLRERSDQPEDTDLRALDTRIAATERALAAARLRLDALRLIRCGEGGSGGG